MSLNPRSWSVFAPRFKKDGTRPAELVLANADILTCDAAGTRARALAVDGGRIVYVGDDGGVADYVGPETVVVNGRGRVVTPGFVDNHCHVLWIGALTSLMTTDLFFCEGPEEMKKVLLEHAEAHAGEPVVLGQGWKHHYVPRDIPQKDLLDSWIPDRPVALMSYDGQTGWVNSKMLELMQERNHEAFQLLAPKKDEQGRYNGLFGRFHAINPLDYFSIEELGDEVKERMLQAMSKTLRHALSVGVTTMDDVQIYRQFIPLVLEFRDRGGLDDARVRCAYYVAYFPVERIEEFKSVMSWWKDLGEKESGPNLVMGESLKFYIDGVGTNHTSLEFEPYPGEPENYGDPVWTQEEFNRVMEVVDSMDLQACTHSDGTAGIHRVLNSYEHIHAVHGERDIRHRLEHCPIPMREDIERMARLRAFAAMQPAHFFGDETAEEVLGPEKLQNLMPWRSMEEAGVELSFGSDWVAGPINPVYGLIVAATRINYKLKKEWAPEEAVTLENAIRHWTIDSARALKMEEDVGSLEVGKYGDFAMFNTSPLKLDSWWFLLTHDLELGALDDLVDLTVVGGRVVHRRKKARF